MSKVCKSCRTWDIAAFLPHAWLDFGQQNVSGKHYRCPNGQIQPRELIWADDPKHELGLLKDILSRVGFCPLCTFVIEVLQEAKGIEPLQPEFEGVPLRCRVYGSKIGDIQEYIQGRDFRVAVTGWHVLSLSFTCFEKVTGKSLGFAASVGAQIGPKPLSWPRHGAEPTYLGRCRPSRCDVSLFKEWLRCCTSGHSHSVLIRHHFAGRIRLIDVENRCLTHIPNLAELDHPYLTLSYVWGSGHKDYVLGRRNYQQYHQPGGLGRLPKSIEDAIKLVQLLGQKFIWVDALCIVQDDPQDKLSQIPAMEFIYGGTYLTIIAAAGQNADAGLPGVDSDRKTLRVVELDEFTLIESARAATLKSHTGGPLSSTTWNTRAWTFQELLLSPRCLIFMEDQALWRCEEAEWFEKMDFDAADRKFVWGNNDINARKDLTVENFGMLLEQYTRKKLSYEEDIYNASAGILGRIPDQFFWGLPYSKFGVYLAWDKTLSASRTSENGPLQRRKFKNAPSWSWMAWKGGGGVSMNHDGMHPQTFLSCYRFQDGKLHNMSQPTASSVFTADEGTHKEGSSLAQRLKERVWQSPAEHLCEMQDIPQSMVLSENHVIFWTFVVNSRDSKNPPGPKQSRTEYALIGAHGWGNIHVLKLSYDAGVARREALESWESEEWDMKRARKRLVILG